MLGEFNVVCDLGVYCVSYEMGCRTKHSVTVLQIRSTVAECSVPQLILQEIRVAECSVPQLIFLTKWVAEQGILKLYYGSIAQLWNALFRKSFRMRRNTPPNRQRTRNRPPPPRTSTAAKHHQSTTTLTVTFTLPISTQPYANTSNSLFYSF